MSKFYGTIVGNRSAATRGGSANSGFLASAQSYDGSIVTHLDYDNDGVLKVRVGTNDGSSCCADWNTPEFNGTFEEFKDALKLLQDIKDGKVSVVRHRAKSNKMLALERAFAEVK